MEDKTQHRLAAEMEIALMKAHLRLDISQMMDKEIKDAFQRVYLPSTVDLLMAPGSEYACN